MTCPHVGGIDPRECGGQASSLLSHMQPRYSQECGVRRAQGRSSVFSSSNNRLDKKVHYDCFTLRTAVYSHTIPEGELPHFTTAHSR